MHMWTELSGRTRPCVRAASYHRHCCRIKGSAHQTKFWGQSHTSPRIDAQAHDRGRLQYPECISAIINDWAILMQH